MLVENQKLVDVHFDSSASYWSRIYNTEGFYPMRYQQRRDVLLAAIDEQRQPENSRALEVGCGAGLLTVELARRGYQVEATDTVEKMTQATAERAEAAGVQSKVQVGQADVRKLPYADGSFHLVVSAGVLQWLPELETPLQEMARVLKPGAVCVMNLDNSWSIERLLDPLLNPATVPLKRAAQKLTEQLHLRQPKARARANSMPQIDRALQSAGLRKIKAATFGFGPFTFLSYPLLSDAAAVRLHRRMSESRALRGMGHSFVVVAEK